MSATKSKVWKFFTKSPSGKYVICSTCQKSFKYCNNTTNMKEHLRRNHAEKLLLLLNENSSGERASVNNEDQISAAYAEPITYANNSTRKKLLDRLFTQMVAIDMEPLRMSEHQGLKAFVHALDPKYEMPARTTLTSKLLPELHNQLKVQLSEILNKVTHLAITFDMWTSVSNLGIGAITAHFIIGDKLESALLAAKYIEGHHDANTLTAAVKEILEQWNVEKKVVAMITDNAAVMVKVASNLQYRHIGCFAHTLNNVVRDTFIVEEFKTLRDKCKHIVTFFRHSELATYKLSAELKRHNKDELKLIQETETRWNSTFEMLKRIRELRDELSIVICQCQRAPENLTAEEYGIIEEIEKLLEPFEICTEAVSGDEYATISLIIPLIKGVCLKLSDLEKENWSEIAKKVMAALRSSVTQRLKQYETRTPCIVGTLLNPHFKKQGFKTESDVEKAVSCVQREYANYLSSMSVNPSTMPGTPESSEPSTSKKSKLSGLLHFLDKPAPATNPTSDAIIDIRQYLEKPLLSQTQDPIQYWLSSQSKLKDVALKFLCIPATSTPAERIFSTAGQIITDRRSRLSTEHVDALLFIRQNHKLFK